MKHYRSFITILHVLALCFAGKVITEYVFYYPHDAVCIIGGYSVKVSLDLPETVFLGEAVSGSCTVNNLDNPLIRVYPSPYNKISCSVTNIGGVHKIKHLSYQQNFSVNCSNGNASSVEVNCLVPPILERKEIQGKLNNQLVYLSIYGMCCSDRKAKD